MSQRMLRIDAACAASLGMPAKFGFLTLIFSFFILKCCSAVEAGAAERSLFRWTEDIARSEGELEINSLMSGVLSEDILWANGYDKDERPVSGDVLFCPLSKKDLLPLWMETQSKKNGGDKPIVTIKLHGVPAFLRGSEEVKTSSERLKAASDSPPLDSPDLYLSAAVDADDATNGTEILLLSQPASAQSIPKKANAQEASSGEGSPPVSTRTAAGKAPPAASSAQRFWGQSEQPSSFKVIEDKSVKSMRLIISGDEFVVLSPAGGRRLEVPRTPPKIPPASRPQLLLPQKTPSVPPGKMMWPVSGKITSSFGKRGRGFHSGLDMPMPKGTPILAAMDGVVKEVCSSRTPGYRGYGNGVLIEHANGLVTMYAHCSSVKAKVGQRVRQGDVIAYVGNTGRTTTHHVHFEVRLRGKAVNPLPYMGSR